MRLGPKKESALIVGYVFAIRSERLLCREVKVNLAYRWFCGLSIEDKVPDHSAFSRGRHERLRGPCGAQDALTLAAIAQNLRRLAKLVARPSPALDACLA